MKSAYYWSPSISKNIATNKAVINSAYAINRYSKRYKDSILNVCGEFDEFENSSKYKIDDMIKNGLKTSRKFTIFNHYKTLINILE